VEVTACFAAQGPEKIYFPAERVIGFAVFIVNKPPDSVKQKRQKTGKAEHLIRSGFARAHWKLCFHIMLQIVSVVFSPRCYARFLSSSGRGLKAVMFSTLPSLISRFVIQLFLYAASFFSPL
jgi:hypothetical protein